MVQTPHVDGDDDVGGGRAGGDMGLRSVAEVDDLSWERSTGMAAHCFLLGVHDSGLRLNF